MLNATPAIPLEAAMKALLLALLLVTSNISMAGQFVEGTPINIRKSDWSKNLIFIRMAEPVSNPANCTSNIGVVIYDENPSSKAALSFAITALTTGMKFRCYVEDECSKTSGNASTYPVCSLYPELAK